MVDDNDDIPDPATPVAIAIDGTLDLHHFSPKDLGSLIPDYLEACLERGIVHVRLIHGRGIGAIQRSVHALLARNANVISYRLAEAERGGRGATLVDLRPRQP